MSKKSDAMSPDASPGVINAAGVRRVNNLPLVLVIGVLALFMALIVFVAMKRANTNQKPPVSVKSARYTDSTTMATDIIAGHTGGIIRPAPKPAPVQESLALPIAVLDNPDAPPVLRPNESDSKPVDPDLDRIKMTKIQQFEDAVKAKMSVALPSQLGASHSNTSPTRRDETQAEIDATRRQIELIKSGDTTAAYQARLAQIRDRMAGGAGRAFEMSVLQAPSSLNATGDRWALNSNVQAPRTPFELRAGAVIPGTMISGVKPGIPGQIIGQVSQNVYDTATGKYLLIPQGTRLIGVYSSEVSYGQDCVLVAWQRLIFPDGKALDIGSMPGADSAGYAGFHDQVDNHYMRIYGSALMMSGIVAGITYSQTPTQTGPYGQQSPPTAGSVMSEALGQQLGQVASQMIAKNLNIAPSLKIRPGYPFNVTVVKDLTFTKPYQSFDY